MPDEDGKRTEDEWNAVRELLMEFIIRRTISREGAQAVSIGVDIHDFEAMMPEYPDISIRLESDQEARIKQAIQTIRIAIARTPPPDLFSTVPIEKIHMIIAAANGDYIHFPNASMIVQSQMLKFGVEDHKTFLVNQTEEISDMLGRLVDRMDLSGILFDLTEKETPE